MTRQGFYGTEQLATDGWFELSRYFVMLLRKVALIRTEGLTSFAKTLGVNTDNLLPPATGLALELLPVEERALLLAGAWEMLCAGPERFLAAARGASLAKTSLREQRQHVPDLIETLIETLPGQGTPHRRGTKRGMHRPRSRQAVMRMFARLQRKMLVAAR